MVAEVVASAEGLFVARAFPVVAVVRILLLVRSVAVALMPLQVRLASELLGTTWVETDEGRLFAVFGLLPASYECTVRTYPRPLLCLT